MPSRVLFLSYALFTLGLGFWFGPQFDYRGFYEAHWRLAWESTPYSASNSENVYPPAFFYLMLLWKIHPTLPKLLFIASGLFLQWQSLASFLPFYKKYTKTLSLFWVILCFAPIHFFLFTVYFGCGDAWLAFLIFSAISMWLYGKDVFSGFFLAFAGFTKFYPFFLLPIFSRKLGSLKFFTLGFLGGTGLVVTIATLLWQDSWLLFFQKSLNYEAELASLPASLEQLFGFQGSFQFFYHLFFLIHFLASAYIVWIKRMDPFFSAFFLLSIIFATFTMGHVQFLITPILLLLLALPRLKYDYVYKNRFLLLAFLLWNNLVGILYFLEYFQSEWIAAIGFREYIGFAQYLVVIGLCIPLIGRYPTSDS